LVSVSGTIFELIPQERNLLAELGGRLRALMPTLLSQWELGLDDILRKEQEFVSKGLREESLAAAHGLLQGMSEGRVEDAWQEGEAYGKSMARQGLDYRVLGNWLSLLCQTLLAGLAQVCGDDDRLEQTIVVLGRFLSTYTFRVTASFSKRQQRSSQEQQEALQRDYEASQRRITELVVLNEIGQAFSSTIDLADLLEVIYRQIGRLMDTNCFFIALCDWEQGLLHFVIDQEEGVRQAPHSMDIQEGLSGYVARTGQPLFLPHGPEVFLKEQGMPHIGQPCKCWLGVPMVIQERTVGVIAVQNYQEEQVYDQDHQRVLSTVAAQAAAAVENAHLYREAHRRVEQFSALQKISLKLASTTDLSEVLDLIADSAMGLLQSSDIIIFLYEASRGVCSRPCPDQMG
jgi:hypothetical protein